MKKFPFFRMAATLLTVLPAGAGLEAQPIPPSNFVLVSDIVTKSVLRVDAATGAKTTFISASAFTGSYPGGMAIGPDGNLYVLDTDFNQSTSRILKFDALTGQSLGVFASGSYAGNGFGRGYYLAFDPDGNAYVQQDATPLVVKLGPAGQLIGGIVAGGTFSENTTASFASGIAVGADSRIYLSVRDSSSGNRGDIARFTTSGQYVDTFVDDVGLSFQKPIWDGLGNFYAATGNWVVKFNAATGETLFINRLTNIQVTSLGFAPNGDLLAGDTSSSTIYRIGSAGEGEAATFLTGVKAADIISQPAPKLPPTFAGLGYPGGGSESSVATAVSADGSVVLMADLGKGAYLWKTGATAVSVPLTGGLSDDGAMVVGVTKVSGVDRPAAWTSAAGITVLQTEDAGTFTQGVTDISADKSVIVGSVIKAGVGESAARWAAATGFKSIGFLGMPTANSTSYARAVSVNGSTVVGSSSDGVGGEAFRYVNGTMTGLGKLASIGGSSAWAVSADGSVIVGHSNAASGEPVPFRWTAAGGMKPLLFAGSETWGYLGNSSARGVSGDGALVVGELSDASFDSYGDISGAFVWDAVYGMRFLRDVLIGAGVDLTGWTLDSAVAISTDGSTIVGNGTHNGKPEAWRVTLPRPDATAPAGPVVTTTEIPGGRQEQPYSVTLAATGTAPFRWAAGQLPSGLSLSADGELSGTPQFFYDEPFRISVRVADATGRFAFRTFDYKSLRLTITTPSLPTATVGVGYAFGLTVANGTGPYEWTLLDGTTLPAGMEMLSSIGHIQGTPTVAGTVTLHIQVKDAFGGTDVKYYQLTVGASVSITTTGLASAAVGEPYGQALIAQDGMAPYAWSVIAGSLPAGLSLDADGTLSGTPTAAGSATFTVQVTDAYEQTATKQFTLTSTSNPAPAKADWYAITAVTLPKGGYGGALVGVNASGQAIGNFYNAKDAGRGFVWKAGKLTQILPPGATESVVAGINASGDVVGSGLDAEFTETGFFWRNGVFTTLLPPGAVASSAQDINDAGQVVGSFYDAAGNQWPFLWSDGAFVPLQLPGGKTLPGEATAISASGQVLGTTSEGDATKGFLWQNGAAVFIEIPGAEAIAPYAVNGAGQVVGAYSDEDFTEHAFLWENGVVTPLNPPGAVGGSAAHSINVFGQIVGSFIDANDNYRAFLWHEGKFTVLVTKLPEKSGWTLEDVQGIDDSGLIVGLGTKGGAEALFLLAPKAGAKPKPTPAPTIKVKTKTLKKTTATVKGAAGGKVTAVYYRVNAAGAYKKAAGKANWSFTAKKLKKGTNVIFVYAQGPGGKSPVTKISLKVK